MRSPQSGFTLIELVTVLVILGIISAIAIPRFADISKSARIADVNGMLGAVRSAAMLAYSQALVSNQAAITGTITMENTTVNLTFGYPDSSTGIGNALSGTAGFTYNSGANITSTAQFNLIAASTPSACAVTYVAPTVSGGGFTASTITSGC